MLNENNNIKYPRTLHLPNSQTVTADDRILKDLSVFERLNEVVVTEKMDGENTTLYSYGMHARSRTYAYHPSRTWLRKKHAEVAFNIPKGWRVCGENLYAEHSIKYNALKSYFYIFSIWDENNKALSWEETETWAELLGFPIVPVLYRGPFNKKIIDELPGKLDLKKQEGFVVRPVNGFNFEEFGTVVAKWVRPNHVITDKHWMNKEVIPNILYTGE